LFSFLKKKKSRISCSPFSTEFVSWKKTRHPSSRIWWWRLSPFFLIIIIFRLEFQKFSRGEVRREDLFQWWYLFLNLCCPFFSICCHFFLSSKNIVTILRDRFFLTTTNIYFYSLTHFFIAHNTRNKKLFLLSHDHRKKRILFVSSRPKGALPLVQKRSSKIIQTSEETQYEFYTEWVREETSRKIPFFPFLSELEEQERFYFEDLLFPNLSSESSLTKKFMRSFLRQIFVKKYAGYIFLPFLIIHGDRFFLKGFLPTIYYLQMYQRQFVDAAKFECLRRALFLRRIFYFKKH